MNYNELSSLLLKISGLIIIIFTVINIPNYFIGYYSTQNFFGNEVSDLAAFLGSVFLPAFITIAIGFLLFKFPKTVTNKIIAGSSESSSADLKTITAVAYSAIGMYFVAFSIADLVYWAIYYGMILNELKTNEFFTIDNKVKVIATFVELLIGLILLLGSSGINNLIIKIRSSGN